MRRAGAGWGMLDPRITGSYPLAWFVAARPAWSAVSSLPCCEPSPSLLPAHAPATAFAHRQSVLLPLMRPRCLRRRTQAQARSLPVLARFAGERAREEARACRQGGHRREAAARQGTQDPQGGTIPPCPETHARKADAHRPAQTPTTHSPPFLVCVAPGRSMCIGRDRSVRLACKAA